MNTTSITRTIPAKDIKVGDRIRSRGGLPLTVESISIGDFPGHLSMSLEGGSHTHLPPTLPVEVVVEN